MRHRCTMYCCAVVGSKDRNARGVGREDAKQIAAMGDGSCLDIWHNNRCTRDFSSRGVEMMKTEARPSEVHLIHFDKQTDLSTIKSGVVINGGFLYGNLTVSLVILNGQRFAFNHYDRPAIYVSGNKAWISHSEPKDISEIDWAVGGGPQVVKNGQKYEFKDLHYKAGGIQLKKRRQRTVVGVKPDRKILAFIMTKALPEECAEQAIKYGLADAMLLDGGTSTTWIEVGRKVFGGGRPVTTALVFPKGKERRESMPKVGIDIGHGGKDPGAHGPNGLKEKDVNLGIGLAAINDLKRNGVEVVATRMDDSYLSLFERSNMLNEAGVDLAVSIHCNGVDDASADYLSTFVIKEGHKAETAAVFVQRELIKATDWPDGGVREANLHMVRETNMPAVLPECGFITNTKQEKPLSSPEFQQKLGRAIAKGICEFLAVPYKPPKDNETTINFDVAPFIKDGRTVMEVRTLIEKVLGGKITSWDDQTQVFTAEVGSKKITVQIGSKKIIQEG